MLRVAGFEKESFVDGVGIRYAIFTQGCAHNCLGCHNPTTHDFNGGFLIDTDSIVEDIKKLDMLDGITLSGGDPFYQPEECLKILKRIKSETNLNVWCYTGFTFDEIISGSESRKAMLEYIDVLVDGKFTLEQKSLSLNFRGSRNQRLIDVQDSLKFEKVILLNKN